MKRIEELKLKIKQASDAYGAASPIMSDKEFDQLVNELKSLDPTYVDTVTYDDHTEGFEKGKHDLVTGTLAKCRNEEEFEKWFEKHPGTKEMEVKCDGLGLECKYKDGILIQAITRGDGFSGDIITENVKKIKTVIQKLDKNISGSIRGEVVMLHSVFNKKYKDKMKNCRNAAAGILKRLDGVGTEDLTFVAYDMLETAGKTILTEAQKLEFLQENGFMVPDYQAIETLEEALAFREKQYNNRENIDYDIDGVVVKPFEIDYEDLKNKTPKNSCAIKFELDVAITTIVDIEWSQTGKYFTPVAIVEPVELCGVTVKRASCSNTNWMIEKGIEIGKKVKIVRRGEIIPYIEEVV